MAKSTKSKVDILKGCKCLESNDKNEIMSALTVAIEKQETEMREAAGMFAPESLLESNRKAIDRIELVKKRVGTTPECQ